MKEYEFKTSGQVPPDTVMFLTGQQAVDRAHFITPLKDDHSKGRDDAKRLPFTAERAAGFVAGEVVGFEAVTDKHLARVLGLDEPDTPAGAAKQPSKAELTKAQKAQVAEVEAERDKAVADLETANAQHAALLARLIGIADAVAAADAAYVAAGEDETALKAAEEQQEKAETAVDDFLAEFRTPAKAPEGGEG